MALSKDDVLHVAQRARIGLSDVEAEKVAPELQGILDYVGELSAVDVEGALETAIVTGTSGVLRDDVVTCIDARDALLSSSKLEKRGGNIIVDHIIK